MKGKLKKIVAGTLATFLLLTNLGTVFANSELQDIPNHSNVQEVQETNNKQIPPNTEEQKDETNKPNLNDTQTKEEIETAPEKEQGIEDKVNIEENKILQNNEQKDEEIKMPQIQLKPSNKQTNEEQSDRLNIERKSIVAKQDPTSLTYIKYTDGNSLKFPIIRTNNGKYAYCLEHNKTSPENITYNLSSTPLSSGMQYILKNGLYSRNIKSKYMLGNEAYDYYITQSAIKIYLGANGGGVNDTYMSYSTGDSRILGLARQLSNDAKKRDIESRITATISPANQTFRLHQNNKNYVTGNYSVKVNQDYNNYKVTLTGASPDVRVVDGTTNQDITGKTIPKGHPFHLRIDKNKIKNMDIKINVTVNYTKDIAERYVSSVAGYQQIATFSTAPATINANANAKLNGYGYVKLEKGSTDPELTENNDCYSLAGAEYTLFKDKGCTQKVLTLVTDEKGNTPITKVLVGTYYLKETKPPKGFAKDTKVRTVTINSTQTVNAPCLLGVKDTPLMDPINLAIKKVDSKTKLSKSSVPTATLEGAEFEFKFYKGIHESNPALQGQKPVRKWAFKTDKNGHIYFLNSYKISGDELFKDQNGIPSLPFGTLTIQEKKSPEGFLINDTVFVVPIKDGGSGTPVFPEVTPVIPETLFSLNLVKKIDGTEIAVPNAVFEHTSPQGVVTQYTTNENGQLSIEGLQYGVHTIKEKIAPAGFILNKGEVQFKVKEDNSIEILSNTSTDKTGKITLETSVDGNLSMVVNEKLSPFTLQIVKENNKHQNLQGAEFTLSNNKDFTDIVDKQISDDKGILNFKDLEVGKTYYLKESKAPKGYKLPINADGSDVIYEISTRSNPVNNEFIFIVNGKEYISKEGMFTVIGTLKDRVTNMTIVNTIGTKLPITGSNSNLIFVLTGSVLMLSTLIIFNKKGVYKNEK